MTLVYPILYARFLMRRLFSFLGYNRFVVASDKLAEIRESVMMDEILAEIRLCQL